ncbi:MAG TPA: TIGR02452 family protein [Parachlamydiaceae bacterium]|nr:TIGR02452 family protein [Parachlamydiaceae bacterium]
MNTSSTICFQNVRNEQVISAQNLHSEFQNNIKPVNNVTSILYSHIKSPYNEELHPLLKNAGVIQSDYPWVRNVVNTWASVMNFSIGGNRPVLGFFSLWSRCHQEYKQEIEAISRLSNEEKEEIENNTKIYGGETDQDYQSLCKKHSERYQTKVIFYDKSDSLEAARQARLENPLARIAITNFANGVRVGGADSIGGKGSQEEQIFRDTYLRVSLEKAYQNSSFKTRLKTGRYIGYYSAIVSRNVPTIKNFSERFFYISAAAPDLRTGIRSEGNYLKNQKKSIALVESILFRKLCVIMTAAVEEKCDTLILGAFGAGAFGNNAEMVAKIINNLITKDFKGCFSKVVLPIGKNDRNRPAFEKCFII